MTSNSYTIFDFFLNFTNQFADSFLYAYILQIILIGYMYNCAGSGRYWKILLSGSIFGMIGAVIENSGTAWLKTIDKNSKHHLSKAYYCYFLAEIGWIITEFSIPYLNLIKLNTLTQTKLKKFVNYTIMMLFSLFSCSRLCIGYLRLSNHCLYNEAIYHAHGVAFGITAIADGSLSVLIFIELNKSAKKTKEKDGETFNLLISFKKSSLFILFIVDLMSVILAILSIFISDSPFGQGVNKLMKPFHALKSNFLLILAIDAFIFKMRASVDGSYVVSRYLQKQTKLHSNHINTLDEIANKKCKSLYSLHSTNVNTMTNESAINININSNSKNTNDNNNINNNNNNSSESFSKIIKGHNKKNFSVSDINNYMGTNNYSSNKNYSKLIKGHKKSNSSISDINYYMGSSEIVNNMVTNSTSFHSSASSSTLNELPQRAYLKGKRSLTNRGEIDKSNSPFLGSPVSISSITPLNCSYNGNLIKSNSPNKTNRKNNKIVHSKHFSEYNFMKNIS